MNQAVKVFVSSVQKELEDERLIVQNLLSTDGFLSLHCTAVLYEFEPASPEKAAEPDHPLQPAEGEVPPLFAQSGSGSVPFVLPPDRGAGEWFPPDAGPDVGPRVGPPQYRDRHRLFPGHLLRAR